LKKLLALIAFSVLLLVPVGAQQVFANHPDLPCPPLGILITGPPFSDAHGLSYCLANFGFFCSSPYSADSIGISIDACTAAQGSFPDTTLAAQCQGAAVLLNNHCFAELMAMVGGTLIAIDTIAVLVGAIGTDPVITGLVALTMAGVVGQAAWFIHRRKKKILN